MSFFADAAGLRDEACETFGHAISMGLNPPGNAGAFDAIWKLRDCIDKQHQALAINWRLAKAGGKIRQD